MASLQSLAKEFSTEKSGITTRIGLWSLKGIEKSTLLQRPRKEVHLHLIRHTKPDIEAGICYGQSDIQLAASFDLEWTEIREKLPLHVDQIFTSPLSRCTKLSERLAVHFGLLPEKDVRLMEMNFGDWEMKTWDEIDQSELNAWMNDFQIKPCPNGESYGNVMTRLKSFISDRLQEESKYLIVTHGGIIRCFHGLLNNYHGMDLSISYGEIYSFTGNW